MWWTWVLACTGDGDEPGRTRTDVTDAGVDTGDTGPVTEELRVTSGPTVGPPAEPDLRLVQVLGVATDAPTRATVVLDDGVRRRRLGFPALAAAHELPLLGLHEATDYAVEVTLTDEAGRSVVVSTSFRTAVLPEPLPELELLVDEPGAEPGLRVLPVESDGGLAHLLAIDADARPVWAAIRRGRVRAVSFEPSSGRFGWLVGDTVHRRTAAGLDAVAYAPAGAPEPGALPVDVPGLHHEAAFEADGSFWGIYQEDRYVTEYPVSERFPEVTRPATIVADVVVHVGADGAVLGRWPLADLLPTSRIGYDAVDEGTWSHTNAVVPLPGEDAFLVSLRQQDVVARVRASTGELEWILANHDGWPASHLPYLLEPVGSPFSWPYHQHAPALDAAGGLWVFDNGNEHRTTPYSQEPEPGPLYSRVARFEVDPVARTVRQTTSFADPRSSPLYSAIFGNADPLPETGHVLATWGALYQEHGVGNGEVGRGDRSVRVREIDPATGAVVWDLRLASDAAELPGGWQADRAILVPGLYPSEVTETWLDGP